LHRQSNVDKQIKEGRRGVGYFIPHRRNCLSLGCGGAMWCLVLAKTSKTLDFLVTDTKDSAHRSSYIKPILEEGVEALTRGDVDVDKDCPD
jgi:hypothetical protein